MIGIYKIESKDGKIYIGSSKNIDKRWLAHRGDLMRNKHVNPHLQNAWNKYGPDYFTFSVLEATNNSHNLQKLEQVWLDILFQCLDMTEIYNILPNAYSHTGRIVSQEQRVKMSISAKKRWESDEYRRKYSKARKHKNFREGKKNTESQKIKVADANCKEYDLISPDGEHVHVRNLAKFCRDNNLNRGNMSNMVVGRRYTFVKGWRLA